MHAHRKKAPNWLWEELYKVKKEGVQPVLVEGRGEG